MAAEPAPDDRIDLRLATPDATSALAGRIAPLLEAGDTILLEGEIGAGKTHFARALIHARLGALGLSEDVPSPTFTIVQSYQAGGVEIWHADLYRLNGPEEVWELGLEDAFRTAICLVEWPDRLGPATPENALLFHFRALPDDSRSLHISATGDRARRRLSRIAAEVPVDRP